MGGRPFGYEIDKETGHLVVKEVEARVVPMIFDLYLKKRLGSRSVAMWLNERGYRTESGKPWSHMSILTVLRNQAYVGEIYFRGESCPGPHTALVDRSTFDQVHQSCWQSAERITPNKPLIAPTTYWPARSCARNVANTS